MRDSKLNKPRTAKVGAISKAQNCKRGAFDFEKFPKFFLNVIFEQCHSVKKCKRGTLWDFSTSIVLQNIETNEGGTLWGNPKNFKKSRIAPRKSGAKVGSLVCFRGSERVLFFSFRFGRASEVRVL